MTEAVPEADADVALKETPIPEAAAETGAVVTPEADKEQNGSYNGNGYSKQHKHTHPKLGFNFDCHFIGSLLLELINDIISEYAALVHLCNNEYIF